MSSMGELPMELEERGSAFWRAEAARTTAIAAQMKNPRAKSDMELVAATYEGFARRAEKAARQKFVAATAAE